MDKLKLDINVENLGAVIKEKIFSPILGAQIKTHIIDYVSREEFSDKIDEWIAKRIKQEVNQVMEELYSSTSVVILQEIQSVIGKRFRDIFSQDRIKKAIIMIAEDWKRTSKIDE